MISIEKLTRLWALRFKKISSTPFLDAEILLSHILQKDRIYLKMHSDLILSEKEINQFEALAKRRLNEEPIAYLIKRQAFWDFELYVDSSVLIPRADSEILVEAVLDIIDDQRPYFVLDLGAGSGALSLALAKMRKNIHVIALDNKLNALNIIEKNARKLEVKNISLIASNWFDALKKEKIFDIILSNPPYIAKDDKELEPSVLKYEPKSALFSEANGLADLFYIIKEAKNYLKPDGALFLEHGYRQGDAVSQKFYDEKFCHVKKVQDLSGKDRVTYGFLK